MIVMSNGELCRQATTGILHPAYLSVAMLVSGHQYHEERIRVTNMRQPMME